MLGFLFTKTPLMFFVQSFWRDEAFSYLLAKRNVLEILFLTAKDFNPPLYYLILHYWMKLFGPSEIALRSLSLIFYLGTVYVVFLFLTNILKISFKKSLLYLLLSVLNPLLLYYAFEARMYTMLAFFVTLSYYFFYKKNSLLYFLSSVLGLYTHYFMIFVVFAQAIFLFLTNKKKTDLNQYLRIIYPLLLFIPWFVFVLLNKNVTSESFWIEKITFDTVKRFFGTLFTGYEKDYGFFEKLILTLSIGLFFFFGYGAVSVLKDKRPKKMMFLYLSLWGIGIPLLVLIISFYKPLFLTRYLIFAGVGLNLLMVFLLERLGVFFRYLIFILLLIISINYINLQVKEWKKSDYRKLFREIKVLAKKDDLLYVTNELDYFTAQYYFYENRVFIYKKTYEEIPNFVGKVLIPKSKVVNTLPSYPKKAFIITSDSHYDIQAAF